MYDLIRALLSLFIRTATQVHIEGRENVPATGPLVLVTNHLSRLDPPLIFIGVPRRITIFVAAKYRKVLPLRWLVETTGAIWVRQKEADVGAIKRALALLKSGGVLGLSPEGTRSQDSHALIAAEGGPAYLADRTGAHILPVAVWGTEKAFKLLARLRRPPIYLRIGKPFRLPSGGRARGEALAAYTDDLMGAIAALLPPAYRGVYANHPRLHEWEERVAA